MIVSDHSPCTEDLKQGDFMSAWGGIASVQLTLSIIWTEFRQRNLTLLDLTRLLSQKTAQLCRLDKDKGQIKIGMKADFVVWDPNSTIQVCNALVTLIIPSFQKKITKFFVIQVTREGIYHKNKVQDTSIMTLEFYQ